MVPHNQKHKKETLKKLEIDLAEILKYESDTIIILDVFLIHQGLSYITFLTDLGGVPTKPVVPKMKMLLLVSSI